ncbi:MAG: nucleoside hydrolase, partial [Chthoniobacterales bacterium]
VWIDTDLSLGSPVREVDDGYALLLALRSPELQVVGVSTTYGNAPLRGTTERAQKSLGAFGSSLPVYPGAASPNEFSRATAASAALSAALRKEKLTYLALGPLTNLATFLKLHPEQAARIEEVVMIAGKTPAATLGFGSQKKFRIHDANLVKDPAAVRAVFASPLPILLAPIETSSRLMIDRDGLRRLEQGGGAGLYLAIRSRTWLWFWTHFAHTRGGPIFDALAVLAVAQPELVTSETQFANFNDAGELLVRRNGGRKVLFCTGFSPALPALLLRRLTVRKE